MLRVLGRAPGCGSRGRKICTRVAMFPGQGSQFVGMAEKLCSEHSGAKEIFDTASDILKYDLFDACVNGPDFILNSTVTSQPAIFTASMAALQVVPELAGPLHDDNLVVALGLSLGEYTALCFAGCFSFEDGVRLTKTRGEAMQTASDQVKSGMVAVVGLKESQLLALVQSINSEVGSEDLFVANYLSDIHFTLAGSEKACKMALKVSKAHGAKLVRSLPVSGAFHTEYMSSATARLCEELHRVAIAEPRIPVLCNATGDFHDKNPDTIRAMLLRQLTCPIKWSQCVTCAYENAARTSEVIQTFEVGPGTVCADLLRRIAINTTWHHKLK